MPLPSTLPRSSPYPWPYDQRLDAARIALIVAGCDRWWASRCHAIPATTALIGRLATSAAAAGVLVVAVEHDRSDDEVTDDPLAALDLPVSVLTITAGGIDGFHDSRLDAVLRRSGRTHLVLTGLGFEGPVHSTLRSANDRGYECVTLPDACAPIDPELIAASVSTIEMSGGILGAVAPASSVLHALTAPTDHR